MKAISWLVKKYEYSPEVVESEFAPEYMKEAGVEGTLEELETIQKEFLEAQVERWNFQRENTMHFLRKIAGELSRRGKFQEGDRHKFEEYGVIQEKIIDLWNTINK